MSEDVRPPRLTALEVASGLVFGVERVKLAPASCDPVEALERALLPALQRPPCLVSFSGGRDSSSILALATRVARREGLPLPIPATNRFPSAPTTNEDEWQEEVVGHLALDDWIRFEHGDELDAVGPYARRMLRHHGLLWPFNAHFHLPILEAASGGSTLTGIGGDEMLGHTSWQRQLDVLGGRARPEPRDLLRLAYFAAPRAVRSRYVATQLPLAYGWLRPPARREVARAWARQTVTEPRRARAHVTWRGSLRYHRVGAASMRVLAHAADVQIVHPFMDATFRSALVQMPFTDRTDAFRALLGDALPDTILGRRTKSGFDDAFFSAASKSFVETWDGRGVDEDVVDPEALAAEWRSGAPDPRSLLLIQATWLATSAGSRVDDEVDGAPEQAPVLRPA